MGEVYRARDTRLDRTVAIKVLPAHLADSPELRQRFEREARAISSLSHPHICSLYDVGEQDGVSYLVMEYLEGETLAARLARGPLPLNDVLKYAVQIADALDKAHRQGVVHRDLKPGNIMLTPQGGAKLMDFGLAKSAMAAASVSSLTAPAQATSPITVKGVIVGTFQYMSPEQVEGKEVDPRSDLFSFGAVLYEMMTGRRAFQGKSQLSVASAILEKEPEPISIAQPMTPPALDRTIRRCLAKDPEDRWQTARDLQLELIWIAESGSQAGAPAVVAAGRKQRERAAWIASAVFALLAVAATVGFVMRAPQPLRALTATILPPDNSNFVAAVVSPDGTRLAFIGRGTDGTAKLWVRSLDAISAQPLSGTDGAFLPFWSADSRSLGFFSADGKLKKIEASGGPPITLCDVPAVPRGGTWNRDGVILFGIVGRNGIQRVSSTGGAATPVTKLDEGRRDANHRWPVFLPDGQHFLYNVRSTDRSLAQGEELYVGSLDGKVNKKLLPVSFNVQYASGHILFVRESTLMAQPFDTKRLEFAGDAFPIAEQVLTNGGNGYASISTSENGVLAYRTGAGQVGSKLLWFDRQGKELGVLGDQAIYFNFKISSSGQKVAVDISDPKIGPPDVWVYDVVRKLRTRLTFDAQADMLPVWSPDGTRVVFRSSRKGPDDLYMKDSSGAGNDELLFESPENKVPTSWSADGRFLLFNSNNAQKRQDIWVLPMTGDRKPYIFLQTDYQEIEAQFSPDGRWVAYRSNESGRDEIYVKPFPGPAGRWQVSTDGGTRPKWRRDGKEIFYLANDDKIMSAEIRVKGTAIEVGAVKPLFQTRAARQGLGSAFDATADGQRFLVNTAVVEQSASPVTLVVNWPAALKK
ncbi:MAG: protein kinase [Acidobacteria bacterium]|nr:protein kinase [Acidobacteriota bacterium]MCL5286468.1 protein kinase [Acidobacteriota bacterium]